MEGRKDLGHKVGEEESPCWGVIRNESEEMGKEQENYSGILSSSFLRAQMTSSVSPGALSALHCYSAQSGDNWALSKHLLLVEKWSKRQRGVIGEPSTMSQEPWPLLTQGP